VRILLIKGQSLYGGTRLFVDTAAEAFARAGHQAEVLDLAALPDPRAGLLEHAATARPDLVFSISILGEFRGPDGRTVGQLYGAPHVVWHVDYSLGQFPRIETTDRSTALLFIDPTHVDAVAATYGPGRFAHLGFMPHAAVGAPALDEDPGAYAARPICLLFSGSFQKPEPPFTNVAPHLHKALQAAVDLALGAEWLPPHEATMQALAAHGFDPSGADRDLIKLAGRVDDVVRRTRRFEFAKAVAKTRLPIVICGVGWEAQLYRFKPHVYEGAVEMTRMAELMRQTRIVLNTNVNFGAGSHERPLSAALAGALPFSDHSRFWEQEFGETVPLYRWKDLDGAMDTLRGLAADPERAYEATRRMHGRVREAHLWDHRVATIVAAAEAVRDA
jgi:hypothetical protein